MEKLHIIDSVFSHATTSSWYNISELFEWERKIDDTVQKVVITDLRNVDRLNGKKVFGWIIEPPEIDNNQYKFAIENYEKFEKIFTYNPELLKVSEKFELVPFGGCWIKETDRKIYEKTKLVCSIVSNKNRTKLHKLRHEILQKFPIIDKFGNGYLKIENKIDVLKDYMFCVVVENQKMDNFFSEKILDCFMTGTIPIYLGCPNINKFFDVDGIIQFDNINDLDSILNSFDSSFYNKKIDVIRKNFESAKKYVIADDIIYKKIKKLDYGK